jgi:hypothetical protein
MHLEILKKHPPLEIHPDNVGSFLHEMQGASTGRIFGGGSFVNFEMHVELNAIVM